MAAVKALPLMRTTERGTFTECQWRWYQSYVLGLETTRTPTWSWFGRAIHAALQARYPVGRKRGRLAEVLDAFDVSLDGEMRRMYSEGANPDEGEIVDARLLGRAMLKGYVKHYGKDQHWQVIHTEQPFQIDVPDWRNPDRILAVYCGTFDMVVYDLADRCFRVVDHKTRRSFPTDWSFYDSNRQGGSYLWVAPEVLRHMGIMGKRDTLDGIVFNCLKKSMPTERILDAQGIAHNKPRKEHYLAALKTAGVQKAGLGAREKPLEKLPLLALHAAAEGAGLTVYGDVSAVQPAPLYHRYTSRRRPEERVAQARHVQVESFQMSLIRRGKMLPSKNTTEDCVRCPLYEMCQLDEANPAEAREYASHMLRVRDPYADHRLDMVEKNGVWVHTGEGR